MSCRVKSVPNGDGDGAVYSPSLRFQNSVPQTICRFSQTEELELIAVNASLPLEIGQLRNLKLLRIVESASVLTSDEFSKIPLTKLERLELHFCSQDNPNVTLPPVIWKLANLRSLCIYSLQKELLLCPENVTNLQSLEIYNPKLESLSGNIGKLKHLKRLRLSCPRLGHLPSEIGNLYQLEVLDFEMCCNLRVIDFLATEARSLQTSLKVIRITHNEQLRNSVSAPFQQTAYLAKMCQYLRQCKNLEIVDLKGNEISDLDGFEALTTQPPGSHSKLRLVNFMENPIIFHSLSAEDKVCLLKMLKVHPQLGSLAGDATSFDKVADAIVLRSWAFPHLDHWLQINRAGRSLLVVNPDRPSAPLSVWPTVFARANHVFSKYRAKKRTANAIFYLLRNNSELLAALGKTREDEGISIKLSS